MSFLILTIVERLSIYAQFLFNNGHLFFNIKFKILIIKDMWFCFFSGTGLAQEIEKLQICLG